MRLATQPCTSQLASQPSPKAVRSLVMAHDHDRPESSRARVLVIDDDEIARQVITDLLERHGYEVYSTESPMGASHLILTKRIDAAVVDLHMPTMNGDTFIMLLRAWPRLQELPTIVVTGERTDALEALRRQLPETVVLSKRQLRSDLADRLDGLIMASRADRK
jgi:CheY-like chemotaxis protein